MKLTNNTNLPLPLLRVAEKLVNSHPVFDNSKFSVTEMLKSDKQVILARRHAEEIEMDVQDTFSMWNGTAIHALLEDEADKDRYIVEQRFNIEDDGLSLSGGFDLLDIIDHVLYDYKTTKVATFDKNTKGSDDHWYRQLAAYCDGIELKYGWRPEKIIIVAMLVDHSKMKVGFGDYPTHPIMQLEWDTPTREESKDVIDEMFNKAFRCSECLKSGEEPPKCTYRDCWCTEDYAVIKKGAKRAVKCFDNEHDAREYHKTLTGNEYRIMHRISEATNCKNYCQCRAICEQGKMMANSQKIEEDITDYVEF